MCWMSQFCGMWFSVILSQIVILEHVSLGIYVN